MIDQIFQKRPKKTMRDLNIVPILDMLTTVIFFLLMSTSFIEYTKLTLPPSQSVSAPAESTVIPLAPRLLVFAKGNVYSIRLTWQGAEAGQDQIEAKSEEIVLKVEELLKKFKEKHTSEKTLQIALEKSVSYQTLISIMDASKDLIPDVVLLSYNEVNAP